MPNTPKKPDDALMTAPVLPGEDPNAELDRDVAARAEAQRRIAERLEHYPVRITQLAHGLPVGGELDYLDEGTLAQALRARRPVG